MHFHLQQDDKYDTQKVLRMTPQSPWLKWIVRAMLPYTMLKTTLINTVFNSYTKNPLHDGIRDITGVKNVALGKKIELDPVKVACKRLGVTVNDMMTCALSIALKRYFISVGDD